MFSDLRAKLEVAIEKVLHTVRASRLVERNVDADDENSANRTSDNDDIEAVRSTSLRPLIYTF